MTQQERKLWLVLRNGGLNGLKFRRQMAVGRYIVDFAHCPSRLIVELDGGQHTPDRDAHRTAFLEAHGWRVLRFWNTDIETAFDGVLLTIAREAGCPLE